MDDWWTPSPAGQSPDPETSEHIDPFLDRLVEARAWELRSAQWRARAFAEMAFGGDVAVRLVGRPGYRSFRGLLYLTVPFRGLEDHEDRQSLFLSWAGGDPVLSRVPLIYVFEPDPVPVP
ncbi:MAG: hypothetical protein HKO65_12925 [Gemmatimonadetes bacterium]|nr:hypothetical protein [Gemmatimonadota bacterium]NNM05985.1 hypothetical protein [Gemmatimonadota bacterium]